MCYGHRLGMPNTSTRARPTQQPFTLNERSRNLLRVARVAWADVRDALAEGQRSPSGRFGDAATQAGLRRAVRLRPDWLDIRAAPGPREVALAPFDISQNQDEAVAGEVLDVNGEPLDVQPPTREEVREAKRAARAYKRLARRGWVTGEDPASTAQVDELWARSRALLRELSAITNGARQGARTGVNEAARDVASWTEQGVTAIVRPLGQALATTIQPLANASGGIGIGLILAGAAAVYVMTKKN